jgi:glycosyltransferase involved in cell wall biosynthesis
VSAKPAILIALPTGLTTGGVQTWATRCLKALASRGRATGLLVHNPGNHETVTLDPAVQRFEVPGLPPLSEANGDLTPYLPIYRAAIQSLHERTNKPVIVAPNHLGDCYGLFAHLTCELPIRILGWCHLDIPYDIRVLDHYESVIHRFIPVSQHLGKVLRSHLPSRAPDIHHIPCGVEVPSTCPKRPPSDTLRIIYTGRLDDDIKRVTSLAYMSATLHSRGIPHSLTVVGDGPARASLEAAAKRLDAPLTLTGPRPLHEIAALLSQHDVFVLPSRIEGLSLSMLEAMAHGCVPIVSRTDSGAAQVIRHGHNGLLMDIQPAADFAAIGQHMARAVSDAINLGLEPLSRNAWATAAQSYSIERHADQVEALIDQVAAEPARTWPTERPAAFTSPPGAGPSGTVPPEAPDRLRDLLRSLEGRRVILHGTGRHTLELAHVIAEFPATVIGFTDDDPTRHMQQVLGLPVFAPAQASTCGATDAIISSWINQHLIWNSRDVYERQGLRVHRIYPQAA